MSGRIYIDTFSSLDDMPKRKRRDPDALLAFFERTNTRRVSTFEMDQPIMNAMNELEKRGRLVWVDSGYPWHDFKLNPAPKGPYPWCRQPSVCRGTCPMDPSCGE